MNTVQMTPYKDALTAAMTFLGQKDDTLFIGQQIVYAGNPMSTTLGNVDKDNKMIEVPVMEETQMGLSLGAAITGKKVVSFYPRWDFLISATNQLVNHVDKFKIMTGKDITMLIRVGKGSDKPLDPGHQHKGNYLEQYQALCPNIKFYNLLDTEIILQSYMEAYEQGGVSILVEYPELYYV